MSGESSKRSNLIDVPYQQLQSRLSGHIEDGSSLEQIAGLFPPRIKQISAVENLFGTPNDASRKKIESGTVTLTDGLLIRVDEAEREVVFALSARLDIDEVEALVLLRSFLYNEGLPSNAGADTDSSLVDDMVEAITPFYYSERLSVLRIFIPLFRAIENPADPIHTLAQELLPKIVPDGPRFADSLLSEYVRKLNARPPKHLTGNPTTASRWAKQNVKEQVALLEVLFWAVWSYVPCDGPLVERVLRTAYETDLGSAQKNSTLMLDAEGTQLREDSAAVWILISVEIFGLERLTEHGAIEISDAPRDKTNFTAFPASLTRIHNLVISHGDSKFACTYMAWAFALSRLAKTAAELKEMPDSYRAFFDATRAHSSRSREPVHVLMSQTCLKPDVGLFKLMLSLLTSSPLFVTAAAWRSGSTITDPNAIAYRSVLKGLLLATVELVQVELVPDFDSLVDVWICLFGRSESQSVAGICEQFWTSDWNHGIARRAIIDVARSRFPVQFRPLVRILRAMTGVGFLDTDTLSTHDFHLLEGLGLDQARELCDRHVFYYFNTLSTFTQVIPANLRTGVHALYEKVQGRYGSPAASGVEYVNTRPIKLPGGSILPARTVGRLLSGDGGQGDPIIVMWQHTHSGWKVVLEILTDYVSRRPMRSGTSGGTYGELSFGRVHREDNTQPVALRLADAGMDIDSGEDEAAVTDALDLVRSMIQDNPALAEHLMDSLEAGEAVVAHKPSDTEPPDLVQLTTIILEDALARSSQRNRTPPHSQLITSAISVLSALLALPAFSNRVWLYVRSTASLFGSERTAGFASAVLAAERVTGHYTMTLALLYFVQQLFKEASVSLLMVLSDNAHLQHVKEEVLMRAARFVHAEIWVEHSSWKYAQFGDRFEIGRRTTSFYADVLIHAPSSSVHEPFASLRQAILDAFLFKATTSSVTPLVSSIATAQSLLKALYVSRRYGDARRLVFLLESHLKFTRLLLNCKHRSSTTGLSLLEQTLCSSVSSNSLSSDPRHSKLDMIDTLAGYVKERSMGSIVPLEATRLLFSLCSSLSATQPAPFSIIGHLSDPEATVTSLVRIIQHPYDDLALRNAIWTFIALAVDKEPALATLFVTGHFGISDTKDKAAVMPPGPPQPIPRRSGSAVHAAREVLSNWLQLWESNPQLLSSALKLLEVVFRHGLEHKTTLESIRSDSEFWEKIAAIVGQELGPVPDSIYVPSDSDKSVYAPELIADHAYRVAVKAYAVMVLGLDIRMEFQLKDSSSKPSSYLAIESHFKSEEQLQEYVAEAASSTYEPRLHDELLDQIKTVIPSLTLNQLGSQELLLEREFGDDFAFSKSLLQGRLQLFKSIDDSSAEKANGVERKVCQINLNLSLVDAQAALATAWRDLLQCVAPHLRSNAKIRRTLLSIATSIAGDISAERREGDMVATIHGQRLSLVLALLELAWFTAEDNLDETGFFISLVKNVRGIFQSETQAPAKCFLGKVTNPFHRPLLQIAYFCARNARFLARRPKALNAEQRLDLASMLDATLVFVIDSLRVVFDAARNRMDAELDQDMELLVAVFEQCISSDIHPSSTMWLMRCQETDVIRSSLDLFTHIDLVGLSDLPLLRARRQPLYTVHILMFHMALTGNSSGAGRLASEGVLAAYSGSTISSAIGLGVIDVTLAELPGERSPAHLAYCMMLAIVAGMVSALGPHNHFVDVETGGFVQLCGQQISRALSWTINEPITLPLLEEIERVVELFRALAEATSPTSNPRSGTAVEVLRDVASRALLFLQQLNYALTHPNHLASLLQPISAEERMQIEKDSRNASCQSFSELADTAEHPVLARVVHRLFGLTTNIVSTLIIVSGAELVLTRDQEDWPVGDVLIVPHSKVVLGEPASVGTLLEMGNCALDVLRHLMNQPNTSVSKVIPPASSAVDAPVATRTSVQTARRALEAILLYSVTQLAKWLLSQDADMSADMDTEEQPPETYNQRGADPSSSKTRRSKRQSMSMADRLRRGMTGEMAADLQALLQKAKPVIAKSDSVLGSGNVDLTSVLLNVLQERILIPT